MFNSLLYHILDQQGCVRIKYSEKRQVPLWHYSQYRISFWNQNCIHITYVRLVSLCLDRCSAILCCTDGVPSLLLLGTRLKYSKGAHMNERHETTMGN